MYEFYGLRQQPFGADRRVAYLDRTRRDALASLYFGVLSGRNILVLVGADGLGKTLLLRELVARLQRDAHIILLADAPRDPGERWTPKFRQLAKVGSRPRRRSLACHGRDGVILLN